MSISAIVPAVSPVRRQPRTEPHLAAARQSAVRPAVVRRYSAEPVLFHSSSHALAAELSYGQAELFYLQKQIHAQTPMVIVLEDGEQIEGCIEWYDRKAIKLRGRQKTLVYKSAIKYMYKLGDVGR